MKKYFLFTVVLFFLPIVLFSQEKSFHPLFDSAESHYKAKEYRKSLEIYQELTKNTENLSGELYYNIGNCYFKLEDIGRAILYYQKAKKLLPTDEDIKHNLKVTQKILSEEVKTSETIFFEKELSSFLFRFKNQELFIISFFLLLVASILLSLFLNVKRVTLQKIFFRVGIVFFIFFLVILVATHQNYYHTIEKKEGVVIENETEVMSGPNKDGNRILILHSGVTLEIVEGLEEWYKVRLKSEEIGWVEKKYVEMI